MKSLVCGIGFNDADYPVAPVINGKQVPCPFYRAWGSMLNRCYGHKYKSRNKTYSECVVCDEWLTFSNFKLWMKTQDWQGNQLDKDILISGNKVYSPETCVFVDSITNSFTSDHSASCKGLPIGVTFNKRMMKFQAQCSNPFTKKRGHVGYFDCPQKAHQAWLSVKSVFACKIASMQMDERVASALILRYSTAVNLTDTE